LHPDLAADVEDRFGAVPQQAASVIEDVVSRIEQGARQCVAPSAHAHPFGSSVNGFGEVSSDLDVVLAVDQEDLCYHMSYYHWHQREQSFLNGQHQQTRSGQAGDGPAQRAPSLFKVNERVASACAIQQLTDVLQELGFQVLRSLPRARRPLVTLRDRKGAISECDVSINNCLPRWNTQLLRAYSVLDDRLRPVVLLVKAWAKNHRVCGAIEGNLSSYAWTIMVIYYFQLVKIVPSLQMLAEEPRSVIDSDYWSYQREFDTSFLPAEEFLQRRVGEAPEGARPDLSMADILHGFFRFFAREYRWGSEIVSIRCPERRAADAWWRLYGKVHPEPGVHVEDPIELRDLNIVLRRDRLMQLKAEFAGALDVLERGGSLEELMSGPAVAAPPCPTAVLRARPPGASRGQRPSKAFSQRRTSAASTRSRSSLGRR